MARMLLILLAGLGVLLALLASYTQWQSARITARYPPRGAFVPVTGGSLHYTQLTPASTERGTVVLLHGASGNEADMMIPLGAPLAAQGFRVIAFDRPGYGWSERPDGRADADPARQANLIVEGLARLGIHKAIVLAHSLAGVVATNLALDHADVTQGLVLVAPVTHPWPGGDIDWYYRPASMPVLGNLFTETLTLPAGQLALGGALVDVFAPQPVPENYAVRARLELVFRPATFRANAQDVAAIYAAVSRQAPRLGNITAPTAIVTGDADRVVLTAVHSYGSAHDIPKATLTVLPGVGHSPHWAAPEKIVAAVEEVASRAGLALAH